MNLHFTPEDLRPLVEAIVEQVLRKIQSEGEALAMNEAQAAALLGLKPHQLRDARRRGMVKASVICGRRIRYRRQDLIEYLERTRI